MKRENGFYFVRLNGEWIVAHWQDWTKEDTPWMDKYGEWYITANETSFIDSEFDDIDENRIIR